MTFHGKPKPQNGVLSIHHALYNRLILSAKLIEIYKKTSSQNNGKSLDS